MSEIGFRTPFPVYWSEIGGDWSMDVPNDINAEFWQAQGCRWEAPPTSGRDSGLDFGSPDEQPRRPPPTVVGEFRNVAVFSGLIMIREFCEWWYRSVS